MLNQTVIVGRLTKDPEMIEDESGKKRMQIIIAVSRSFKNIDGIYESDFIRCVLWNGIAQSTSEYCKKGDVVGIKGRLQSNKYEKDGKTIYGLDVVVEKISFLSRSGKTEESQEENQEDNE